MSSNGDRGDGLRLEYVPLDAVEGAERNPREWDLGAIHTSVAQFGYVEPVVADERTGRLVAGHGRVTTLRQLAAEGGTPPSGIRVDGGGRWLVPVVRGWRSRSDADAAALLVALNRTGERASWEAAGLAELLGWIAAEDEALLAAAGYDMDDFDDLLARISGPPDLDALADAYQPPVSEDGFVEITVRVTAEVAALWDAHAAGYASPAEALGALLT